MVDLMLSTYHEQLALTENILVKWANSQGAEQTPKDVVVHYELVAGNQSKIVSITNVIVKRKPEVEKVRTEKFVLV